MSSLSAEEFEEVKSQINVALDGSAPVAQASMFGNDPSLAIGLVGTLTAGSVIMALIAAGVPLGVALVIGLLSGFSISYMYADVLDT